MATEATHGAEMAEHGAEAGGLVFHPMDQFIVKPLFGDGAVGMFTITTGRKRICPFYTLDMAPL